MIQVFVRMIHLIFVIAQVLQVVILVPRDVESAIIHVLPVIILIVFLMIV